MKEKENRTPAEEPELTKEAEKPDGDPAEKETQAKGKKEKKSKGPTLEEIRADYEKALQEKDDKFMRLAAEYDNFRKRSSREREGVYADATIDAVKELLPVLDNLERALAQENASAEDLGKGLQMTLDQFAKSFEKLGVEAFGVRGDAFDPQIHNAVMQAEDAELEENQIAQVFAKGYKIGDKVIRHAMVQVAK